MRSIELKWKPREEQIVILDRFKKICEKNKKFLFVDAAVGTGKSYSIIMMANYYKCEIDNDVKFDVVTNTKILQEQYLRDFPFMKSIKGMDNYFCSTHSCTCSEGMEMEKIKKQRCHSCPYKIAKTEYVNSVIGLLNTHIFINFLMYTPDMMESRGAKILFVDEAHSFEETYCDFIDAFISKHYLESIDSYTEDMESDLTELKRKTQFAEFLKNKVQPEISKKIDEIQRQVAKFDVNDSEKIQLLKEFRKLYRIRCKYNRFLNDEENWDSNWIMETQDGVEGKGWNVEAVWAKKYLSEIWNKYDKVVFLSGTILDKVFFANLMGVDRNEAEFVTIDSPFPIENRKIIFKPIDKLSFNRKRIAFENMLPEIRRILEEHKDVKGIIHTANYELARWIEEEIEDKEGRLLFHDSHSREMTLQRHYNSSKPTVLVSPSLINGVDLHDDLSRFQIIVKIPFKNLSSKKVKRRMESDSKWYLWCCLVDLLQSYGRSIRNENDWAMTYILDENFNRLVERVNIPKYLSDAIIEIND